MKRTEDILLNLHNIFEERNIVIPVLNTNK